MDQIVPDDRSKYEDLTLFSVSIVVNDDVTELYGVLTLNLMITKLNERKH